MEVSIVQSVNIVAESFPKSAGQFLLVTYGGDGVEMWPQRRDSLLLDESFIHVSVVKSATLRAPEPAAPLDFGKLFDQSSGIFIAEITEDG